MLPSCELYDFDLISTHVYDGIVDFVVDVKGIQMLASTKPKKVPKDPAIRDGMPLPAFGTCKHYKKSFRWLR